MMHLHYMIVERIRETVPVTEETMMNATMTTPRPPAPCKVCGWYSHHNLGPSQNTPCLGCTCAQCASFARLGYDSLVAYRNAKRATRLNILQHGGL